MLLVEHAQLIFGVGQIFFLIISDRNLYQSWFKDGCSLYVKYITTPYCIYSLQYSLQYGTAHL